MHKFFSAGPNSKGRDYQSSSVMAALKKKKNADRFIKHSSTLCKSALRSLRDSKAIEVPLIVSNGPKIARRKVGHVTHLSHVPRLFDLVRKNTPDTPQAVYIL